MNESITEHMLYTGRVQGVGFRYSVRSIATRMPVKGYVRNCPDGSVELVAQGAPAAVDRLVDAIAGHFQANITHCERRRMPPGETFLHFDIRF